VREFDARRNGREVRLAGRGAGVAMAVAGHENCCLDDKRVRAAGK
jgi:hypothetical protein